MTLEMFSILIILGAVIILFITGWIRMDIVPLLIPVALVGSGLLAADQVFAGFSSSAVITVASLFIITTGLVRSGVVNRFADLLSRFASENFRRLLLAGTLLPGFIAGFVIVTATVLFFIPTTMRMAFKNKIPQSRMLLPLVASCLLGANLTLIGASHNLLVNNLLEETTGISFSFFEFFPAGATVLLVSVLYNLCLGSRLLPDSSKEREAVISEQPDLITMYGLADRLWEVWVPGKSKSVGKNIVELGLGERYGLSVVTVARSDEQLPFDCRKICLQKDDVILILGREEKIKELVGAEDLFLAGHPHEQKQFSLSTAELVEVVVPPRSPVLGSTLVELGFREKTGLSGIALWRKGRPYRTDVGNMPLQEGDGLLLFGDRKKTRSFRPQKDFRWLHPPRREEAPLELKPYAPLALTILFLVILCAAFEWLPIAVSALTGAALMVLSGIVKVKEMYESIDWRIIILIGCLYPLGIALQGSGLSALLADKILLAGAFNPLAVLALITVLSICLTQPLHNVAAAVIMTPIAINTAQVLGADPKSFIMAVIIGASTAFMLPTGHPASLLVKAPGAYQVKDYLKYGSGLCLIVLIVVIIVVPQLWPFYP